MPSRQTDVFKCVYAIVMYTLTLDIIILNANDSLDYFDRDDVGHAATNLPTKQLRTTAAAAAAAAAEPIATLLPVSATFNVH